MIKKIDFKLAINTMIIILISVLVFHLLILAEIVPYDIVWGGRLENKSQMRIFEIASITINLFMISVVAIKGGYIRAIIPEKITAVILWAIVVLFSLNTIGNILSNTLFETIVFTPVTFTSAILCYRIVIEKSS